MHKIHAQAAQSMNTKTINDCDFSPKENKYVIFGYFEWFVFIHVTEVMMLNMRAYSPLNMLHAIQ